MKILKNFLYSFINYIISNFNKKDNEEGTLFITGKKCIETYFKLSNTSIFFNEDNNIIYDLGIIYNKEISIDDLKQNLNNYLQNLEILDKFILYLYYILKQIYKNLQLENFNLEIKVQTEEEFERNNGVEEKKQNKMENDDKYLIISISLKTTTYDNIETIKIAKVYLFKNINYILQLNDDTCIDSFDRTFSLLPEESIKQLEEPQGINPIVFDYDISNNAYLLKFYKSISQIKVKLPREDKKLNITNPKILITDTNKSIMNVDKPINYEQQKLILKNNSILFDDLNPNKKNICNDFLEKYPLIKNLKKEFTSLAFDDTEKVALKYWMREGYKDINYYLSTTNFYDIKNKDKVLKCITSLEEIFKKERNIIKFTPNSNLNYLYCNNKNNKYIERLKEIINNDIIKKYLKYVKKKKNFMITYRQTRYFNRENMTISDNNNLEFQIGECYEEKNYTSSSFSDTLFWSTFYEQDDPYYIFEFVFNSLDKSKYIFIHNEEFEECEVLLNKNLYFYIFDISVKNIEIKSEIYIKYRNKYVISCLVLDEKEVELMLKKEDEDITEYTRLIDTLSTLLIGGMQIKKKNNYMFLENYYKKKNKKDGAFMNSLDLLYLIKSENKNNISAYNAPAYGGTYTKNKYKKKYLHLKNIYNEKKSR